MTPSPRTHTLS
ncbi:unnamed protein product [Timema podura]|uniref:Uncharacterized protein n=1 Tax=Timema podura TaxID=61482 RepID=A0ABN7PC92_TIMPD|nr:unnamed protein product [Timema podura]